MSNKCYDILKQVALILPVINTFIVAIMKIWNIPYAVEVGLSLSALNTLIAGIVQVENKIYKNKQNKK